MLKNFLYRWLLPKLFQKKCGERIPRSGEKGERVNCFSVGLDDHSSPFLLARDLKNDEITGIKWNGSEYIDELSVQLIDIDKYDLRVTHYYGLSEISYNSIYNIAWHYITKQIYVKIIFSRIISSFFQYFFNKKKLITKKRMELLQFMLDNKLDYAQNDFFLTDLMTKLYSIRWASHPSADDQMMRLEIYLESLVESGELTRLNTGYCLTGKAISTIEKYEEEERRHIARVKLQRRLVLLTLILVLIGLIQAGLIVLPPLIDFSGK